jgi:hypothetical protein
MKGRGSIDELRLGPNPDRMPVSHVHDEGFERLVEKLKKGEQTMHYRDGRNAKNGDTIVQLGNDGTIVNVGVLHDATPGNDHCNGKIAPISTAVADACLCDCLHIEDVAELLKEKGLDKRPAGK